jgi:hypothetical protein
MISTKVASAIGVLLLLSILTSAQALPASARVGDIYEITLTRASAQQGSNGSSGSTNDKDTLIEKVTGIRADGVEVEYDLPKETSAEERADSWQYPVQVFEPYQGPWRLLNGAELEKRVDEWLKTANWTRAICGHWIFTWNAFRIECDPQSAIETAKAFDLGSQSLHEGDNYQTDGASGVGKLIKKSAGADGEVFTIELPVDADLIRRARAQSDVAAGEILNKPVTMDAALRKRAKETISGTVSITLETDPAGHAYRRTKITTLAIQQPDGQTETETVTETLERRAIS